MNTRKIRLKAVWLFIVPFFWWASPTPLLLAVGGGLATIGLAVRAAAAGFIHKDRELTTTGPYAYTRNPLYLGSLLLGLGVTVAGGRWWFVVAFLLFFAVVYRRTIQHEARQLEAAFGDAYRAYAGRVPLFVPRLIADRGGVATGERGRFSTARWRRNREYEALLGALGAFALLTWRMLA